MKWGRLAVAEAIVHRIIHWVALVLIFSAWTPAYSAADEVDQAVPAQKNESTNKMTNFDDSELANIVVTGSHLAAVSETPTPVAALSAEQMNLNSPVDIADSLNQLPMFAASERPSKGTNQLYGGIF